MTRRVRGDVDATRRPVVCAGLSPAWQQVLVFDRLVAGEVNRAREAHYAASGKVLNAARAAARLGAPCRAVTVAGGPAGRAIVESLESERIAHVAVTTRSRSRTCTTVIDRAAGTVTELVENAPAIGEDELAAFHAAFREATCDAAVVLLLGSLPAGVPASLWRELVEGLEAPVLADIRGPELLELLETRPLLVKPNRDELERTLGVAIADEPELLDAMRTLNERGAAWVLVTRGAADVLARNRSGEVLRFRPPRIAPVNTIGCGDALGAGIAVGIAEGQSMSEAMRLGLACAAENALALVPGDIEREAVWARFSAMALERE